MQRILETALLSVVELDRYCREKSFTLSKSKRGRKAYRKRIKELEKKLKRKDADLAETAALLELRIKSNAHKREDEDN
ncbi:hypothetical protein ACPV5S_01805 [Vibrio astriarenae]